MTDSQATQCAHTFLSYRTTLMDPTLPCPLQCPMNKSSKQLRESGCCAMTPRKHSSTHSLDDWITLRDENPHHFPQFSHMFPRCSSLFSHLFLYVPCVSILFPSCPPFCFLSSSISSHHSPISFLLIFPYVHICSPDFPIMFPSLLIIFPYC